MKNKKSGLKNEIGPNEAQNKTEDRTVQAEIRHTYGVFGSELDAFF